MFIKLIKPLLFPPKTTWKLRCLGILKGLFQKKFFLTTGFFFNEDGNMQFFWKCSTNIFVLILSFWEEHGVFIWHFLLSHICVVWVYMMSKKTEVKFCVDISVLRPHWVNKSDFWNEACPTFDNSRLCSLPHPEHVERFYSNLVRGKILAVSRDFFLTITQYLVVAVLREKHKITKINSTDLYQILLKRI